MILTDTESKNNEYICILAGIFKNNENVLQLVRERCLKGYCEEVEGFTQQEYLAYRLGINDFIDTFVEAYDLKATKEEK